MIATLPNPKRGRKTAPLKGEPFDQLGTAATIERNHFKYKSLSSFACNISLGCVHACRFCYVPDASAIKRAGLLRKYGILDPDAEWGQYSLLRTWDEKKFLASLRKAENTPPEELNPDGNRAVIYCSTTDPYQTFAGPNSEKIKLLNGLRESLVRSSLELILEHSTLNVRILTRSPLARKDFDLYRRCGPRLVFGMSLPTLDNDLASIYEPKAPAPSQRLKTLQAAKEAGLHVYVAMAPTYPDCDEADLRRTLTAIKELKPITIYHEPINIRAENVERIAAHAKTIGKSVNTDVFNTRENWRRYAIEALATVERLANEMGLGERLHLWPDKDLLSEAQFLKMQKAIRHEQVQGQPLTRKQTDEIKREEGRRYAEFKTWIETWHHRVSEWP